MIAPANALERVVLAWPEAELQSNVVALVKAMRGEFYHTHDSRRSNPGYPDLHIWFPRARQPVSLFRELKKEKGVVTTDQQRCLDELGSCGQDVGVWRPRDWVSGRIQDELREAAR